MGQRRIGQGSLAEALLPAAAGSNRRLERIVGLIDWAPMERLLAPLRAPTGRPGYPPLALLRALLLAQWYQLSDPGLEEALADRLSFRRFCGFGLDDGALDETTLCRFHGALAERRLAEALFAELNRQLDAKGLVLKAGTLIDATLVEAAVARPPQSEGEVSTKDPEAGFTRRGQRSFFGFKAHVALALGSDLIRDAVLTGADVPCGRPPVSGDSLAADGLVQGDEAAVFMEPKATPEGRYKAYDSAARREALAEAGIADGIMHRGHARAPLTAWQRWMNTALAPIRGQVERAFGTLKRSYGWRRVRYRGMPRNGAHPLLLCTAINLRRAERLVA
jgi:IS5 family transposase